MQQKFFVKQYLIFAVLFFSFNLNSGCQAKHKNDGKKGAEEAVVDYNLWKIENGKFYLDGEWQFLKIGKPLKNFSDSKAVDQLIQDLDILKEKNYQVIEINCYWHHFDFDGDGNPDVSLAPLHFPGHYSGQLELVFSGKYTQPERANDILWQLSVFAYNISVMMRQKKDKFKRQEHFTLLNLSCRTTYLTGQAFIDWFISVPAKITMSGHQTEIKMYETSMIKYFTHMQMIINHASSICYHKK